MKWSVTHIQDALYPLINLYCFPVLCTVTQVNICLKLSVEQQLSATTDRPCIHFIQYMRIYNQSITYIYAHV